MIHDAASIHIVFHSKYIIHETVEWMIAWFSIILFDDQYYDEMCWLCN